MIRKLQTTILIAAMAGSLGCQKIADHYVEDYLERKGAGFIEHKIAVALEAKARGNSGLSFQGRVQAKLDIPEEKSPILGNQDSDLTVVTYLDFTDARSKKVYQTVKQFTEDHNAKWVYKFYASPKKKVSLQAAQSAMRAIKGKKFPIYADALFTKNTRLTQKSLKGLEKSHKLLMKRKVASAHNQYAMKTVMNDINFLQQNAKNAAPAVFINGVRLHASEISTQSMQKIAAKLR